MGPPKQAEKPIIGERTWKGGKKRKVRKRREAGVKKVLTAILMLATRSAREFPIAKIVIPMMASDNPKMVPKVYTRKGVQG